MSEVLVQIVQTPMVLGSSLISGADPTLNQSIYYQRGSRKGQLKLKKEIFDVMPALYAVNRYLSYDKVKNFHVK